MNKRTVHYAILIVIAAACVLPAKWLASRMLLVREFKLRQRGVNCMLISGTTYDRLSERWVDVTQEISDPVAIEQILKASTSGLSTLAIYKWPPGRRLATRLNLSLYAKQNGRTNLLFYVLSDDIVFLTKEYACNTMSDLHFLIIDQLRK